MAGKIGPFRLAPWFSERLWGRRDLRPWFQETGTAGPVGEAWLTGPESVVESGPMAGHTLRELVAGHADDVLGDREVTIGAAPEFPLLLKMLFPAEKLSVQVHPDDAQARAMGQARGKTECWYVLEAEPGAAVGLGLKPGTAPSDVQAAVADGMLEEQMQWLPVEAGEMIFVDAGTVHAVGAGLVLLETQQTSDTTFRLYDYGRPRELHLEDGLRVMRTRTRAGKVAPRPMDGFTRLIEQQYFTVDRYGLSAGARARIRPEGPGCIAGLHGTGWVCAEGTEPVQVSPGRAVVLPVSSGAVEVESPGGLEFVRCFAPSLNQNGSTENTAQGKRHES